MTATAMVRPIDVLHLHPDAERVPLASSEDLRNLRASLEENGQQDPIDITPDDIILDGRTRWTLLRDLGAQSVQVRVVDLPAADQTHYIIDRALARRHLTNEQKRALNALLRVAVVEVIEDMAGAEMRIGMSRPARAAKLGVEQTTVKRWDAEDQGQMPYIPSAPTPTHIRRTGGNTGVYPIHPTPPRTANDQTERPAPLRKSRPIPAWSRHFTAWCRGARPEDRAFLRRLDRELHEALVRNGVDCKEEQK